MYGTFNRVYRVIIKDQFGNIQNLQTSPIPQTNFLVGTFFAASYSKTALANFAKAKFFHINNNCVVHACGEIKS